MRAHTSVRAGRLLRPFTQRDFRMDEYPHNDQLFDNERAPCRACTASLSWGGGDSENGTQFQR